MKVGFVGLGIMGRPMCKNLLKAGYAVTAYDPFAAEALDDVVACGAVRGTSNADVASKSDLVITMVPNSPHVREAVFGKGGIAEGAKPGLDIIDMSSIAPLESKDIAADYAYCVEQGYSFEEEGIQTIHTFWENGVSYFKIMSPTGEPVEFCQIL